MAYTKKTWVSGETPLSAENMNHIEQGVADAHNDISSLNTNITHAVMPDYAKQTQVSSPYVAVSDGWIQCSLRSIGKISAIRIDGATVFNIGQTMSSTNYVTNFVTVPIAKGKTATLEGTFESMYFIPCIGA